MPVTRTFSAAFAASLLFFAPAVAAQDGPGMRQIHPPTMVSLGFGVGEESLEVNRGEFPSVGNGNLPGVVARSADAFHFRFRGEHFFGNDFGVFANFYVGQADDINEDLGSTDSSLDSSGFFIAVAYRATMDDDFRLPVRFGPFVQASEYDEASLADGAITYTTMGVRLSAEPEFILWQTPDGSRVSECSLFADLSCGAGPTEIEDDAAKEDAYAFTFSYELGVRYRFASGLLFGASWYAQKYHIGTSESYDDKVFFGVDDDFTGIMLTAGLRF
jgi:hypothetical protein